MKDAAADENGAIVIHASLRLAYFLTTIYYGSGNTNPRIGGEHLSGEIIMAMHIESSENFTFY